MRCGAAYRLCSDSATCLGKIMQLNVQQCQHKHDHKTSFTHDPWRLVHVCLKLDPCKACHFFAQWIGNDDVWTFKDQKEHAPTTSVKLDGFGTFSGNCVGLEKSNPNISKRCVDGKCSKNTKTHQNYQVLSLQTRQGYRFSYPALIYNIYIYIYIYIYVYVCILWAYRVLVRWDEYFLNFWFF